MKKTPTPEEVQLWKNQLKDVKPLSKEERAVKRSPAPKRLKISQPHGRSLEKRSPTSVPALAPQSFGRKDLRHLTIDGRLDMHGMTLDEGYSALERFLHDAQ